MNPILGRRIGIVRQALLAKNLRRSVAALTRSCCGSEVFDRFRPAPTLIGRQTRLVLQYPIGNLSAGRFDHADKFINCEVPGSTVDRNVIEPAYDDGTARGDPGILTENDVNTVILS